MIDEMEALTAGGTERQILQIAQLAQSKGFFVTVCVLRGTEWLDSAIAGAPLHFAAVADLRSIKGFRNLWRLILWMRSQRFDILQTFFVGANLIGPVLGCLAGIPVRLGSRRNLNYWMSSRQALLQCFSNLFATRLVANCEAVKRVVHDTEVASLRKIDVVYNGIELSQFRPDPRVREEVRAQFGVAPKEVLVGNVSTLRPVKGTETFIEAAAYMKESCPSARCILVGDGPLMQELRQMVERAGLAESFIFTGPQEDIPRFLQAFDIAVLSSDSEGFSNSILEYMAMGLPIVATDVGGNAEALGDSGRIVPPGDARAIASAIADLVMNPSEAQKMGKSAAKRVEMFDITMARERLCNYYFNLAKQSH